MQLQHNDAFTKIFSAVLAGPTEVTLTRLLACYPEHADNLILDRVLAIFELLDRFNLAIFPGRNVGELDDVRLLRIGVIPAHTFDSILSEARNESGTLELKSSFHYDHRKAQFAPESLIEQLQSPLVKFAFLKTIAAFLNTDGGVLLCGVADDGTCVGIQHDFPWVSASHQNGDGWQLHVRDVIRSAFRDGATILDYIQISTAQDSDGRVVARVAVAARRKLSFLIDDKKRSCIFRRQGNQTIETSFEEIEEFLERRGWQPK